MIGIIILVFFIINAISAFVFFGSFFGTWWAWMIFENKEEYEHGIRLLYTSITAFIVSFIIIMILAVCYL